MPEVNLTLTPRQDEALYEKLLPGKLDHLTSEDRRHIEPILIKYTHFFHDENENDFKCTNVVEHQIQVGDQAISVLSSWPEVRDQNGSRDIDVYKKFRSSE